ncbi:WXG100 family type VII secretion target [Streptomyces sp. NPDC058548]|uniref:WXG100 family type VII secretion target n=1 Tax=unclassified Streptomyces TaxID=2593676 RepID=UPI00365556AD
MTTPPKGGVQGFQYATQEIQEAIDQLAKGNDEVEEIVANLKSNVELNMEGWIGGSKDEFTRVHAETTSHVDTLSKWLADTRASVLKILQDAVDDDGKGASLFRNA